MKRFRHLFCFQILFFFLGLTLGLQASDDTSFTLNFPLAVEQTTPVWLGKSEILTGTLATLNLPMTSPDPNEALIVTIVFQEKEGGFLRVNWVNPQTATCLSNNLYENIGMANKRSLLIDAQTLQGGGTLNFQASSPDLGIQRIKFEWLKPATSFVTPLLDDTLVTTEDQVTQKSDDLNGQAPSLEPCTWLHQVVTTLITDTPQRVEQGVEYNLQLDQLPQAARIALKENGLPFSQRIVVWINQQRAGTITPAVPDLTDPGFLDANSFTGWREGSFSISLSLLKVGVNTVQFSPESDVSNADTAPPVPTTPLALKEVTVQCAYPVTSSTPVIPAVPPSSHPIDSSTVTPPQL